MKVLVVNAGSSSLKYQLFDTTKKEVLAKGICERIGIDGNIEHRKGEKGEKITKEIHMPDHAVATRIVVEYLTDKESGVIETMDEIEAVGHRIVSAVRTSLKVPLLITKSCEARKMRSSLHAYTTASYGICGCLGLPNASGTRFRHRLIPPSKSSTFPISKELREKYPSAATAPTSHRLSQTR